MRAFRFAVVLVVVAGLAGCGSDKDPVMPDVTGTKLDVAKKDIDKAGFDDKVEVEGGGLFGVVKESNWEVCEQSPAAGKAVTGTPTLTVERSCDDDADEPSKNASPTASETPEPAAPESSEPEGEDEPVLTAKNSKQLAALLKISDPCDAMNKSFAKKYAGRTIEFDGSIVAMANHGDTDTRYDILVGLGGKGPETVVGPAFKFEDKNTVYDMHFSDDVDGVGEGDLFRFTAEVDEYNERQCLFLLEPVSTMSR